MWQRYMMYQRAFALWKFLQGKDIPEEDRSHAEQELNLLSYHIMMSHEYRRKKR